MKYNPNKWIKPCTSLLPASRSGASTVNGTGVDSRGYKEALIHLHEGAHTGAGTNTVIVEESDDNVTFTPITGATFGTIVAANHNKLYVGRIKLENRKRYLRVCATDAAAAVICGASIILCAPKVLPVSQEQTVAFSV